MNIFHLVLTDFLPAIIGSSDYDNAVNHVLDCLQNPKVTRYILYICSAVFNFKSLNCMQSDRCHSSTVDVCAFVLI